MKITLEVIKKASIEFDGTCPFATIAVECSEMSVLECNSCHRSWKYRDHKEK